MSSLTNTKTGFSVKDILDLPDTNDEEGSIAEGADEDAEGTEPPKKSGGLGQSTIDAVQGLPLKNPSMTIAIILTHGGWLLPRVYSIPYTGLHPATPSRTPRPNPPNLLPMNPQTTIRRPPAAQTLGRRGRDGCCSPRLRLMNWRGGLGSRGTFQHQRESTWPA
ncbi:unnamed protein product [Staurois parvus]|uniref:Uncharacterized protein n=1 Tax=Staurois parvus TaxID=386267 RepID=A0ABN9E2N6_9NEOB|nr:unnamed protein product [Staurois parvus]